MVNLKQRSMICILIVAALTAFSPAKFGLLKASAYAWQPSTPNRTKHSVFDQILATLQGEFDKGRASNTFSGPLHTIPPSPPKPSGEAVVTVGTYQVHIKFYTPLASAKLQGYSYTGHANAYMLRVTKSRLGVENNQVTFDVKDVSALPDSHSGSAPPKFSLANLNTSVTHSPFDDEANNVTELGRNLVFKNVTVPPSALKITLHITAEEDSKDVDFAIGPSQSRN